MFKHASDDDYRPYDSFEGGESGREYSDISDKSAHDEKTNSSLDAFTKLKMPQLDLGEETTHLCLYKNKIATCYNA